MRRYAMIAIMAMASMMAGMTDVWASGRAEMRQQTLRLLEDAQTGRDSVGLLLDLFDMESLADGKKYLREVLDIAIRENDPHLALDMIRHLGYVNVANDSVLSDLEHLAVKFPPSIDRKMTLTYLSLRRAGNAARYTSSAERIERTKKAVRDGYFNKSADIYDKIRTYGTICILLGNGVHRGLLTDYLHRTLELIPLLPKEDFAVRNLLYFNAADLYTKLDMPNEAIQINLLRLNFLDSVVERRRQQGRPYFSFDFSKSRIYQSMIQNYDALSRQKVEDYYEAYRELSDKIDGIDTPESETITEAYYAMATERYGDAIPLLKDIVNDVPDRFVKKEAISELIKAAEQTGDRELLFESTRRYNTILQNYINLNAQETYSELQVFYDINEMREREMERQVKEAENKQKTHRQLNTLGLTVLVVLVVAMILIVKSTRRSRRLTHELAKSNEALRRESEDLHSVHASLVEARDKAVRAERHKTEFINSITHEINTPLETIVEYSQLIVDCTDSTNKRYLKNYADIVKLNVELFQALIRDILDIGSIENKTFSVTPRPCTIDDICQMAFNTVINRVKDGVEYTFVRGELRDTIVITDSKRVEQVLINLLDNAAKFTEQGSIRLTYEVDKVNNTVSFIVRDTGPGIPPNMTDKIFSRFVKLDKQTRGVGLGLAISRMIAELLHGTLELDITYKGGSRFVFTIPMI